MNRPSAPTNLAKNCAAWTRRGLMILGVGLALLGVSASVSNAQQPQPPNIAAAADLKFALDEVGAAFTRDTGKVVTLTYGSSGNFLRQIQQGAPFQMFLSADEGFVRQLADAGKTVEVHEVGTLPCLR